MADPVLTVRDLHVSFAAGSEGTAAVQRVSFDLHRGRTLALVGESGCGKTVTALSMMGLLDHPGRIEGGSIRIHDQELVGAGEDRLVALRGNQLAMIFQEPMTALNPVMRVGEQVSEPLRIHRGYGAERARGRAIRLLTEVGIPSPRERFFSYPHELSGGMRQRVVIAMALACEPDVIIADEPTTALDVTIQAQILRLLRRLQKRLNMAMLFITHDLGLLPVVADDVAVMYAGRIVEVSKVDNFLYSPRHPYADALLRSVSFGRRNRRRLTTIPGTVPEIDALPTGCAFRDRCSKSEAQCEAQTPPLEDGVACFFPIPPELPPRAGDSR